MPVLWTPDKRGSTYMTNVTPRNDFRTQVGLLFYISSSFLFYFDIFLLFVDIQSRELYLELKESLSLLYKLVDICERIL